MERGDLFELRAQRQVRGHEQHGRRYGVVLQGDEFLSLSTVVVAPTSTSATRSVFRPEIQVRKTRTAVLIDQLVSVDLDRLGDQVGRVSARELQEVDKALAGFLGLSGRR